MSGYLYNGFITYLYNNPLIILNYCLLFSLIILFINKVKPIIYLIVSFAIVALSCCLFTNNLLYFLVGMESYNLLYLLLLYNVSQHNELLLEVRKLSLLSMIISSIMVFGTTLVFLDNHTFYFNNINTHNSLTILGLSFFLIGILFKLCVFPFHIWILNIYKKFNYYIALISDCFFKLILLQILLSFINVFSIQRFNNIFIIFGIISMFLGIILSIRENNIKKFIGLFNISHIGLIILLLSVNNINKYISVFGYLLMYSICSLAFLLAVQDDTKNFTDFKPQSDFIKNKKIIITNINKAILITSIITLLAMICIPPFHTFLAKIDLILIMLQSESYTVLILSTMYFILEIIVVILKLRFIIFNQSIRIQSSYQS